MSRSDGNTTMTLRNRILLIPVFAALGTLLNSCSREIRVEASPQIDDAPTVAVVKIARTNLSSGVVLTAEFAPFQEVDVMAKVSGYIRQINVDIGSHVRQGQVLAVLEIPEMQDDLARAEAATDEAAADLATARDELRRAQSAHDIAHLSYSRVLEVAHREPGLIPQEEVDEARSRDLMAEAQVSAAQSEITSCEQKSRVSQAEQARLKTLYRYAVITAPFAGVVTKRYANTGTLIQAGTSSQTQAMPVVRLAENGLLRLALPVPESSVPLVRLGESVEVKVPALNRLFLGKVARFADEVDESTRTMKTEVDAPNPNFTLVPGMYAEVDLTTGQEENVLAVPQQAIDGDGNSARIFLVQPPGQIHIVPVRLGIEGPLLVGVESPEVHDGDQVIVGSRSGLRNGQRVQPKIVHLAGDTGAT